MGLTSLFDKLSAYYFAMRKRHIIAGIVGVLLLVFLLGPKQDYPIYSAKLNPPKLSIKELDKFVLQKESGIKHLKADNHARIIWMDSIRKTPFSIVYLHGFSASPMEGAPIHQEFAKRYGCNLYLPRLAGHGLSDKDSFKDLTPKDLIESAKEALQIGKLIGEKVILMSTSTGGTLSAWLAANYPDDIFAQIMYSPNIDLYDGMSEILILPWGLQMARMVQGDYRSFSISDEADQYWTTTYRTEGLVCVKTLIEETMTDENFRAINQPLFLGYYYKNEEEQDKVVSVEAMKYFFENISTTEGQKMMVAFPNAASHVVCSGFQSRDLDDVRAKSFRFAETILGLTPANPVQTQ